MANKIGIVLALDGEKEFVQGLNNANKAAQAAKAELKNLSAQYADNKNSLEYLEKAQSALTSQTEAYTKKVAEAKNGLDNANKKLDAAKENYEKLKKQIEEAKKQLEEMTKSGKEGSTEYEDQAKKVKALEEALKDQGTECGKCEGKVSDWQKRLSTAESELAKTNTAVDKNEQYLEEAKNATDKCATSIDKYGKEIEEAGDDTKNFGNIVKANLTSTAITATASALKNAASELKDVAKEVVEIGSEFSAAMSEVEALSGATGDELEALTEKAKELGETTKYSATEAAEAFQYMSLAGWDTEEMLDGIDGIMNLAAASGMELADASDMVTDYLSAFSMEASDAAYMADLLAYAQSNSNTTAEQLGEAYGNCAADLNAAGQDIETVTSLLEAMANQGTKGSEAGTALKNIMKDITDAMEDGAISIGDSTIAIADAEGNYRDLTDIIKDIDDATSDMTQTERASQLQSVFTTKALSGLNLILNEGVDNVEDYEEALRDCDGAAADMADTMQDNLSGDLTKMNSALQGLAIEAYDYVEGPLRGVVQGVTTLIGGITDVITPQESELESIVKAAKEASQSVDSVLASAQSTVADAETDAAEIEILGQQLISLNETEDLSLTQKERLKTIVDELSDSIPELAEAYNEETGKVDLNSEAIQGLIDSTKDLMIVQAMESAAQEELNAYAEASLALQKAQTAYESYGNELYFWQELASELEDLDQLYMQIGNSGGDAAKQEELSAQRAEMLADAQAKVQEAYESGTISAEEYNQVMNELGLSTMTGSSETAKLTVAVSDYIETYADATTEAASAVDEATVAAEEANRVYEETNDAIEKATEALTDSTDAAEENTIFIGMSNEAIEEAAEASDDYAISLEELGTKEGQLKLKAAKATDALEDNTEATEGTATAAEDAADSEEELTSALDDAAAAAEKSAEAQEAAYNTIYDAYTSTMESIESDLKNKIDLSSKFDGGDDNTTETMNENLDSYLEGLKTYQENLQKVREMTDESGAAIFSDEVLAEIESQGTDMANMLEHIVWTYENQGEYGLEQVQGINDKYQEALDMSEEIAAAGAANQTAYELAMGELGSSDVDFSNLTDAIGEAKDAAIDGWNDLTEETQTALDQAVQTAQEMGVQIPEGLADNIASGQTSAEQAVEQLNASIQGTLEGLLQVAEESGAYVAPELAAAITDGTADAETAMQSLLDAITGTTADSSDLTETIEDVVSDGAEAITDATDDYSESGEELIKSVADGISEGSEDFETAIDDVIQAGADAAQSGDNTNKYKEAGKALASAIADGLAEGASESGVFDGAAEAIAEALSSALSSENTISSIKDAGGDYAGAVASGIDEAGTLDLWVSAATIANEFGTALSSDANLENIKTEAAKLAKAVTDELNNHTSSMEAYGNEASGAYAGAISSQTASAENNGKTLASKALSGVLSNQASFQSAGYNMSQGVATGIALGQSQAVTAAINMAQAALKAAKDALEIQSPSKKFKKDVGEQISKGMAFGIRDSANLATDQAEKMSSKVYKKAVSWLSQYKQSQDVSLEDEKYYWQKVVAHCEEGTAAYEKALTKYSTAVAKIIKGGVSTTTTTGSGDNEKTVAKDAETYYSDIYEAAEDYMDKLQTLNDVSLDEQLAYWEAVQKQLKKGTDAWYNAQKEINSITEEYQSSIVEAAETTMEHMEIMNDVSYDEQIEYWKTIRSELKKYSDEWYEVTEKIKELQEDANSSILSSAESTLSHIETLSGSLSLDEEIKYWENVKSQLKKYSDEWYEVVDKINDLTESRYDEMYSAAEDYASKMDTLDSWSLSEQLAYWEAVQSSVKKGSDAWYNAQSKINSIKSNIGTVSNMSSLLSAYTTYYDLSEKAEMQYWDTVRQQYEEGTDERLEADQNYLDAKEAYYDKLEELEEDYADSVEDIEENLASKIESLTDSYESSLQSRIDSIASAYSLFDEFTSESADGQTLLFNMQSQAAGYEAWSDALDALEERGILSDDLLEELTEMGPDQLAAIYALSDLTDEELTAYQEAYDRKMDAATKQAEEDTADLKEELESQTAELTAQAEQDKADLLAEYESNVASVNTTISSELLTLAQSTKTIAEDQTTALVNAISGGVSEIKAVMSASSSAASSAASTGTSVATSAVSSSSGSSSSSSSASTDDILEAIYLGPSVTTLTSAQRKKHHDLYLYLVDNYGHGGNKKSYKKLASLLGVSIAGDSVTSDEKDKILKKLKKKGYKSGGRDIDDELVWMDEELDNLGPEMVVSRSDNALLTRIPAGSDIINADTTSNLLRLSEIDPDELMNVLVKQQAAATESLNELNTIGNAQLNDLAMTSTSQMSTMPDLGRMESMMEDMQSIIEEFLPYLAERQSVYLDGDKVVGGISDRMSTNMAMRSRRKRA